MTYQQTLDYLYTELPMFQRVGPAALKPDLRNTLLLCGSLGNPQHQFKSIHVGGTNGKGSSSHMIAAILQSQGYKTGLYTSPHLKEFTERIKLNGIEIPREEVVSFVDRIRPQIAQIKPSFFEITVAMAFDFFARQKVDFAVIEVGLGGRLDSTNVIVPLVALITNIGYDHKDLLGGTLGAIASEKAGIIKHNSRVVISERQPEIENVFVGKARMVGASIKFAQDYFKVGPVGADGHFVVQRTGAHDNKQMKSGLVGGYQRKNLAGVLAVVDELIGLGHVVSEEAIEKGIANTVLLTGLKGRWQQLGTNPLVYCDTAHNAEGIEEVLHIISTIPYKKLHIVFGMVKDKDSHAVLSRLPKDAIYYFCQAKIPRALDANTLAERAAAVGLSGHVVGEVTAAIKMARAGAGTDDLVFIGGSTFVVAEIENL
ncbi:MAG: bifunctional folylpolyglutamate synthase/dihydrofolate synthase [Cyclobacteriaceae bacterium]|nr:bifunctional folylpolyglutamate synthase/dihydrofolate synthase [Cyclobacteriaceae bacterium]MCB0499301.1 bifunctional folylpolyglutamate synthase/dihydrofolate synthase [Cyclobacteriaceae bacterium]MCB9236379.1 bifunctional folylpolyglutamate synthase/dihydrofolate synthase [Flammeovirgaceae bacterium]MCO5272302.1 bifunctional folylpolyglutamate synthase/dihydrofolate synthase [Cyclobacteriaceae bacterium]MCW5902160.1 bifunctional folylpolyglutamate synthase/dihydrofolate synthase [Cyclobac